MKTRDVLLLYAQIQARMERRVTFKASATRSGGNIITGVALPWGIQASRHHPAFEPGRLLNDGLPLPLLIDHNYEAKVGQVIKLWEDQDGLHYVAVLEKSDINLPDGVSIGATLRENAVGEVVSYYVNEISLTNIPAYPSTTVTIVANQKSVTMNKLQELKDRLLAEREQLKASAAKAEEAKAPEQRQMRAQVEELMPILEEQAARIAAIEEQLAALQEQLSSIQEKVASLYDSIATVTDATTQAVQDVQASFDKAVTETMKAMKDKEELLNEALAGVAEPLNVMLEAINKLKEIKK